jgi:predicted AAA+ superfamily ATPase
MSETLAGRIAIIQVSGFTLEEFYQRDPSELFHILEAGNPAEIFKIEKRYTLEELLTACLIGSYPEPVIKRADPRFVSLWMENYFETYVKRVSKMPKGHLRDSGLINFFFRNRDSISLSAHPQIGNIWESFIIEQLMSSFSKRLISVKGFYYRTHNQAEIDLIMDGKFGLLPVEIKFGTTDPKKLIALENFINEHNLPYGLVINNGEHVEWLRPKILQLPAYFL